MVKRSGLESFRSHEAMDVSFLRKTSTVMSLIVATEVGVQSPLGRLPMQPPLNGLYASGVERASAAWKSVLEMRFSWSSVLA